ncbi:MAG TPA: hypothetical protein VFM98_12765, partial [Ramlibacter sp.]|nr:hypothetical protein [Ramlibacter sp.]
MLQRPTPVKLPRQRMSPQAAAATGVLHVALAWMLLQVAPVQQAVRRVVYQAVQPAAAPAAAPGPAAAPSHAITLPAERGTRGDPLS